MRGVSDMMAGAATSLSEVLDWGLEWVAEDCEGGLDESRSAPRILFRGQRKEWPLIPGLYRYEARDSERTVHQLDARLYTRFRREGPGFYTPFPNREWDIYVLMQHVGFPTRCLDFSESLIAALFFALENATSDDCPVVWGLDWNRVNERCRVEHGSAPDADLRERYLPGDSDSASATEMPGLPFIAQGTSVHPRIKVQQGRFCIFGTSRKPLDQQFSDCVRSLEIEPGSVPRVRQELFAAGFRKTMVFPELDALAKDLTYQYARLR